MEEAKYIPMSLVKADKNPNIIWKVKDVSQDKRGNVLYRVVAAEDNDVFIYLYEHQIASIPLTPEILEKNGWKRYKSILFDTYLKDVYTIIEYTEEKGVFYVCIGRNNMIIRKVQFVHQLQHLLFGLGLPMDLKV